MLKTDNKSNLEINSARSYTLDEFQNIYDEKFIKAAYAAILQRDPDPTGMDYYLARVRSGISKAQILNQLKKSSESRNIDTKIIGLEEAVLFDRICDIPIFGKIFIAVIFLSNLKSHLKDLRALENYIVRISENSQNPRRE